MPHLTAPSALPFYSGASLVQRDLFGHRCCAHMFFNMAPAEVSRLRAQLQRIAMPYLAHGDHRRSTKDLTERIAGNEARFSVWASQFLLRREVERLLAQRPCPPGFDDWDASALDTMIQRVWAPAARCGVGLQVRSPPPPSAAAGRARH